MTGRPVLLLVGVALLSAVAFLACYLLLRSAR